MDHSKNSWEYFGEYDPYYSVATLDRFRRENLDEDARAEFFSSGDAHTEMIWGEIERGFVLDFAPKTVLDFGCGVGRLAIPLAKRCEKVLGVDVSSTMLREAVANVEKFGIENLEFTDTDNYLSDNRRTFDLIHSSIVFQHIKPRIGEEIFKKMLRDLAEGGVGVIQFTTKIPLSGFEMLKVTAYRDIPGVFRIKNLLTGHRGPFMPIYAYDVNRLLTILRENDCHKISLRFSDHGSHGVVLFFQKLPSMIY